MTAEQRLAQLDAEIARLDADRIARPLSPGLQGYLASLRAKAARLRARGIVPASRPRPTPSSAPVVAPTPPALTPAECDRLAKVEAQISRLEADDRRAPLGPILLAWLDDVKLEAAKLRERATLNA